VFVDLESLVRSLLLQQHYTTYWSVFMLQCSTSP
jgi:hypothetical protein